MNTCCQIYYANPGSLKPIINVDLQAAVTRLVSRQLAAAWATWQQALLHSKDKQAKAQRALSYLTNSTLRRAFDWWRSHQQLNLEKHDKLLKAVSYFTQGALHRAFDSWRAECSRAAEKQELMRKATNWLLQSGLTKVRDSPSLSAVLLKTGDRRGMVSICKHAVLLRRVYVIACSQKFHVQLTCFASSCKFCCACND